MSNTISRNLVKRVQSFILSRHVETGRVPSPEQIAKSLKLSTDEVALAIQYLIQSGTLFQSGGTLFVNQEVAKTVSTEAEKPKPKRVAPVRQKRTTLVEPEPEATGIDFSSWALVGVQALMFATSAAAVFISIHFSKLWLDSFLSPGKSILLAMTMVFYATVAPQVSIVFFARRKTGAVATGIGMLATSLLVTFFSMISTVAGQYDAFTVNTEERVVEVSESAVRAAEWDLLKTEEAELVQRIADKQEEVDAAQRLLAEFDTLEERTEQGGVFYVNTRNDLQRRNRELEDLRDQLSTNRAEQREALASGDTGYLEETRPERRDFYTWVSGVVSLPPDRVQFWLSVFPAVFVDVIAPLALAVGLFLTRRRTA